MCLCLWCHIDFKAQKLPYPPPVFPATPAFRPPFIWGYLYSRWSICVFAAAVNFLAGGASKLGNPDSETRPEAVGLISQLWRGAWSRGFGDRGYGTDKFLLRDKVTTLDTHVPSEHNKLAGATNTWPFPWLGSSD